jgi:hypothetical protein
MRPIVFGSLGAPFFAQYLAEITNNTFCPNGSKDSHDTYTRLHDMGSDDVNLFMVGLYWPTHKCTKNFYKRSKFHQHIVLFAGADLMDMYAMNPRSRASLLRYLQDRRVIFATECPFVQDRVKTQFGIDTEIIYLPSRHKFSTPITLPDKFTVGCYMPYYRRPFYGWYTIMPTIQAMPDVQFHFYSVLGYQPIPEELALSNLTIHAECITDMPQFISKMSCGIRITAHDTYSMSGIEYNLGGRWFLNNHPMPYCDLLPHQPIPEQLISAIRSVQHRKSPNTSGYAHYMQFHTATKFISRLQTVLEK